MPATGARARLLLAPCRRRRMPRASISSPTGRLKPNKPTRRMASARSDERLRAAGAFSRALARSPFSLPILLRCTQPQIPSRFTYHRRVISLQKPQKMGRYLSLFSIACIKPYVARPGFSRHDDFDFLMFLVAFCTRQRRDKLFIYGRYCRR